MYITLHYERIVIKKESTLNLTHSTYGWLLCWRNGFRKKEYYILYLYSLELLRNQTILYIVISAIQSKFHRFFIFIHFPSHFHLFLFIIFYRRECMWVMCTHLLKCHSTKEWEKENKEWVMTICMLSQMALQLIIISVSLLSLFSKWINIWVLYELGK